MNLSDYIKGNYGLSKRTGFVEFYDKTFRAKWLNNVVVPSVDLIVQHQKQIFLETNEIKLDKNNPILEMINNDINGISTQEYFDNIDKNIQKIETYIETLQKNGTEEQAIKKASQLEAGIHDINSLCDEYENFVNKLHSMNGMKEVEFAFYPLYNKLNILKSYAQSIQRGDDVPWPTEKSFIANLNWVEYLLKGQYLEAEGTAFFKERLPRNITVLNTGSLKGYYDIMGGWHNSGKMKEDLMFFDSDKFMIEFTIGKEGKPQRMTLRKFIEKIENQEDFKDIRITEHGYKQMQKHLITGVQAKATRTNHIKFGNVNLSKVYQDEKGRALALLGEIYNHRPETPSPLRKEHEHYALLFNYNLAHCITHIIGKSNKLLLTRDGITDMYTFILNQFYNGRYFYAADKSVALTQLEKGIKVALAFKE